jgi:hypothetical protein
MSFSHSLTYKILLAVCIQAFSLQVNGQKLKKWELRASTDAGIRMQGVLYEYNVLLGLGLEAERHYGQFVRLNISSFIRRSIPTEAAGKVHVHQWCLGFGLLIMDRKKFPLGLRIGLNNHYYWARYPSIDLGIAKIPPRTDIYENFGLQLGLLYRLSQKFELCTSLVTETFLKFKDPQWRQNNILQVGIRYRWAKGKPDPVGEEK